VEDRVAGGRFQDDEFEDLDEDDLGEREGAKSDGGEGRRGWKVGEKKEKAR